ncbi:Sec-independent protein translocase subunit TatA [Brachybacterium sp. YJGR34]|uniref:Sec-independent protein translocase subunit TatA n=1 Tax=Brachybacterium sp. YJGR34 TaxID=2059911 RepID=UPI000E0BCAB1|nr:Sec-independent protein translocase subunit TatA [Brachybacterium sp. YJGR34]
MSFFRSPWPIVIVVVAAILLFGANKLPGLARNMGKSMRIFKSEVEELRGDEKDEDEDDIPPARSTRSREDSAASSPARDDSSARDGREFDPRDEADRETVRAREDDDSYRRD